MNIQRHFILGDNWVYLKIYTGFKTADMVLTETIYPMIQELKLNQIITNWFFIRYNDPDFHLRIRLYLPDIHKIGHVLERIQNNIQLNFQSGLIWKIQYDTYNREIERYGENTMVLSEQIFCADSEMIVELISNLTEVKSEQKRWLLALRAIDELLSCFRYSVEKKLILLNYLQESFSNEFNIKGDLKKQFSLNFRENRKEIEKIMCVSKEDESLLFPIYKKNNEIICFVEDILKHESNQMLQISLDGLLCSYIHMMINRFFRTQPRKHELILYNYLYRYYNTVIGKNKYQDSSKGK